MSKSLVENGRNEGSLTTCFHLILVSRIENAVSTDSGGVICIKCDETKIIVKAAMWFTCNFFRQVAFRDVNVFGEGVEETNRS